jgi:hypothetical protein
MNLERTSKVTIAVTYRELIQALNKEFPKEFILNMFTGMATKDFSVETLGSGIALTGVRRSQGPAEIDFNRMQRVEYDPPETA